MYVCMYVCMISFGIIQLLECFFKNTTVVKLYSVDKYFLTFIYYHTSLTP